jgi:hypothetical protein
MQGKNAPYPGSDSPIVDDLQGMDTGQHSDDEG